MGRGAASLLQQPNVPDDSREPRPVTLTVKQVAVALGVNEQTVRRAVQREELAAVRIGNKIQILRKEFCEKYKLPYDYDFGD